MSSELTRMCASNSITFWRSSRSNPVMTEITRMRTVTPSVTPRIEINVKIDRAGAIVIERSFPACDADAPFVAGLQSWEAPFRVRRDQIVSVEDREVEKLLRDLHADRVQPNIVRAGATKAVAIKSCHRIV